MKFLLKSVKDLASNIHIYEQMYIYNNDNYIKFNENSQNIYNDNMKLLTYKFYLKHKIVEKKFINYIIINNYGEILYLQEYIQPNTYFHLLRLL